MLGCRLLPSYKGPFKIDRFLTPVTAKLVDLTIGPFVTQAHVSLLKLGSASQD
jgi:hypothetical protein